MFAILSCRHPDTIFQYPDSLNAYPNALKSIQIPSVQQSLQYPNTLLSIRIGVQASECFLHTSGYLPPQQPDSFSSASECLLNAFEYHLRHPNALVRHPDTPQQKFKINSSKFKNSLFLIKIVYYLSLLKIILV